MLGQLQIEVLLRTGCSSDEELNLLVGALRGMYDARITGQLCARIQSGRGRSGDLDEWDFVQYLWQKVAPILGRGEAREVKHMERWLWTIAERLLIDYERKPRLRTVDGGDGLIYCAFDHTSGDPVDAILDREEARIWATARREVLDAVDRPLRQIMEWYEKYGNLRQAPSELGVARTTASRHLLRARTLIVWVAWTAGAFDGRAVNPADESADYHEGQRLTKAIESLEQPLRQVVSRYALYGNVRKAAVALGISLETARERLLRAKTLVLVNLGRR